MVAPDELEGRCVLDQKLGVELVARVAVVE